MGVYPQLTPETPFVCNVSSDWGDVCIMSVCFTELCFQEEEQSLHLHHKHTLAVTHTHTMEPEAIACVESLPSRLRLIPAIYPLGNEGFTRCIFLEGFR